jgi:low affinity Fe/Cu permease
MAMPSRVERPYRFSAFANVITEWTGSSFAFAMALTLIVVWLLCGPILGYSDTWQLLINSLTSIITFLMVFLIQKAQNRDSRAIHIKLNELVAALDGASNRLINVEDLDEDSLRGLYHRFQTLAETSRLSEPSSQARTIEEIAELSEAKSVGVGHERNGKDR